jgi:hypothetical protein
MAPRGARGDPISCSTGGAKNREISMAPWDLRHQFNGISIGISMGNFSSPIIERMGWFQGKPTPESMVFPMKYAIKPIQ